MPQEGLSRADIEALLQRFVERRRTEPAITAARFAAEHPEAGPELVTRLEAALRASAGDGTLHEPRADTAPAADRTLPEPGARTEVGAPPPAGATLVEPGRAPQADEARTIDRRYEVVRVLGEGGFGKVYLVRDLLHQGERRALKTILPTHTAKSAFEQRFRNEILVLRALAHPGIPQIYNDGKTDTGEFYYTMAYVEGPTLAEVLRKDGALPPERVVRLVRQMLSILDYAHGKGVVHRDLKPANVMLVGAGTPGEQVKILDFGIAKVLRAEGELEAAQTMHTLPGMGTPHYMSPEQIRGKDVDARSDMYALGIMIYQMCSGKLPFGGKSDLEIATARLENAPRPLTQAQAPEWLRTAVMQLLERDREKRPTTKEIHERFDRLAGGQRQIVRSLRWTATGVLVVALGLAWILWNGGAETRAEETDPDVGPAPKPALTRVALDEPRDGAHVSARQVTVRGTTDGDGVVVDGRPVPVASDGSFQQVVELPENAASTIVVASTAEGSEPRTLTVVVDTRKPEIVCTPAEPLTRSRRVVLAGTLRDEPPGALVPASVLLDDTPLEVAADGSFSREVELASDGEHRFQIVAADAAGNVATWLGAVTLDTRAPEIVLDEEPPERGLQRRIVLRGRVADAHPAKLRVTAGAAEEELTLADGRFEHALDLELGRTDVTLVALDAAGNASESLRRTLRREQPPVRVLETNLASGATFPPDRTSVTLTGSADRALARVLVNGTIAQADGERGFRHDVPLSNGANRVEIVPYDADELEGERLVLDFERLPLRLPAGCVPAPGAGATADGRALRVVHERSGIPLVLVVSGDVAFYLGETEVTRAQLQRMAGGPAPEAALADHPAIGVAFEDAQRASALAGLRLPTVEEWDLAAGGPEALEYPWGGEWREAAANVASTAAVATGSHPDDVSWCSALDMAGNVSEWCTSGGERALRGGSWSSDAESCKLSRRRSAPRGGSDYVGFRVGMDAQ